MEDSSLWTLGATKPSSLWCPNYYREGADGRETKRPCLDLRLSKIKVLERGMPPDQWKTCGGCHPCGNFSDTSSWTFLRPKGSIGHVFTVCICTENQNQASFSPFGPHKISVPIELTLGHLRYHLTDVPPQPNSPPNCVCRPDQQSKKTALDPKLTVAQVSFQRNK